MKLELNEWWKPEINPVALKSLVRRDNASAGTHVIAYFALLTVLISKFRKTINIRRA